MVKIKRKVIQIANSTQLISLPRKWSLKYNVQKGEELEVEEQGNKIVISTEKSIQLKNFDIDITGLDRTSILYSILALYKVGYDEITVRFNEPFTTHYRTNEKKKVTSVIHEVVNRLTGFEIIQQKENFCVIKEISEVSNKEFDVALRRVFLLLIDASNDLLEASKNKNLALADTIEEKHNTIMKFISYCLRILNKKGYSDHKKTIIFYHILSNIDKIVDVLKYSARDIIRFKFNLNKDSINILENINKSINTYYEFFYKFNFKKISDLYENRDDILKAIRKLTKKSTTAEMLYLTNVGSILELITDITEARVGLEFQS